MRLLLASLLLTAAVTARAQGTSEAIRGYNATIKGDGFTGTVGWVFQPSAEITLTELGCLANFFPNNLTTNALKVGLWGAGGALLASNSITLSSTFYNQSLYAPVNLVPLFTNQTYHIGVYFDNASFSLDAVVPSQGGSLTNSNDLLAIKAAQTTSGGWGSPAEVTGVESGSAYLGPNFRYIPALPEPSFGALLILGTLLLGSRWRSRAR